MITSPLLLWGIISPIYFLLLTLLYSQKIRARERALSYWREELKQWGQREGPESDIAGFLLVSRLVDQPDFFPQTRRLPLCSPQKKNKEKDSHQPKGL